VSLDIPRPEAFYRSPEVSACMPRLKSKSTKKNQSSSSLSKAARRRSNFTLEASFPMLNLKKKRKFLNDVKVTLRRWVPVDTSCIPVSDTDLFSFELLD
jgi:hypothetical protein